MGIYLTPSALYAVEEQYPQQVLERPVGAGETMASALTAMIIDRQWQGRRLRLALGRQAWRQVQLDKPAMPDEELAQALPWCMRELVDEPVEQLLFDYIDLPPGPRGGTHCRVLQPAGAVADPGGCRYALV
ncbi:hypothetical protein MBH78_21750 [Oceanimonas sp. NS1]|nr:hypothetical protein [Oceanimonas sp. NS1]